MGGFFGVASESSCVLDLFFGTDYHSHLGTKRGGMAVYGPDGFSRAIHNIENSPFRTKFERDVEELEGNMGMAVFPTAIRSLSWCSLIWEALPLPQSVRSTMRKN